MTGARLLYEGSVKKVYEVDSSTLDFEFTDAYSVFDWGQMPDMLPGKGEALAAMGEYFFKIVENQKISTHFLSRPKPNVLRVKRAKVLRPKAGEVGGQSVYHYPIDQYATEARRLIPLEVVFRLGIPPGSSFTERLTPEYARLLGFDRIAREGERFEKPVIEFFSKLEDSDRFLGFEQALHYSGLAFTEFNAFIDRNAKLSICLAEEFKKIGLELWDGKFEWILHDGEILLADSIGPDELRLVAPGDVTTQISKEFLRQFYRKTPWYAEVVQAKQEARADGKLDWKERVASQPPKLSKEVFDAASALYPTVASALTGEKLPGATSIASLIERIRQCLKSF